VQQEYISSEVVYLQDGEAAPSYGCLSVLLWPPLSTLLFGALLFWGLSNFSFSTFISNDPIPQSATIGTGELAGFFAPEVLRWENEILDWARENHLDPNLVATVMQIESCGDPRAVSRAGAMGLFQVMPYHFAEGENSFKPETNAKRGLSYLSKSLEYFEGDAGMALAGYNGGIGGASRPANEWAEETRNYKYWGENIYADAAAGRQNSAVLDEWLGAGGASLCAQAAQRLAQVPASQP
jgi:soluble lytic murein transglycosylase-like protein